MQLYALAPTAEDVVCLCGSLAPEMLTNSYRRLVKQLHKMGVKYTVVDTTGEVSIEQYDDTWVVEAPWLQRLIANVNFGDYESRNWFDRQLRESGLFDKLEAMGIKDGDYVSMYDLELEYQR